MLGIADCKVSIHAPTRGATHTFLKGQQIEQFQSTHPHGVRRLNTVTNTNLADVSIHAPTRGATLLRLFLLIKVRFQSTHPHGVRHSADMLSQLGTLVSIHAPTRGATVWRKTQRCARPSFNPRTHTGCDTIESRRSFDNRSFNPRTHTGCDSFST